MTHERNKMMIRKLQEQVDNGSIDNDWEETFIHNIGIRISANSPLTANQQDKLEAMFER